MNTENKNNISSGKKKWELVNFCEFDKYAANAYCAIHNEDISKNLGDITKVDETTLDYFTMICGGSPCQDFSVAGKQKGSVWTCKDCGHEYNPLTVHWSERDKCPCCGGNNIEKTRSSLLVEYLRVIRANKPVFGMYENVKNIVGKQFKETFKMFIDELNEYGYNAYWKVLNTKNYGVPQNRERVYLIFIKKSLDNGKFNFPEPFDNNVRLKDILEDKVDEKFYISEDKVHRFLTNLNNKDALLYDATQVKREGKSREYNEFCPTLTARDYKDPRLVNDNIVTTRNSDIVGCLRSAYYKNGARNIFKNIEDGGGYEGVIIGENSVKQIGNIINAGNWSNPQIGRVYSPDGCSPTLNCCTGGDHEPKIIQVGNINPSGVGMNGNVFDPNGLAPTLTTNKGEGNKIAIADNGEKCIVASRGRYTEDLSVKQNLEFNTEGTTNALTSVQKDNLVFENNNMKIRIRKLTPKECFRLQGFADKDFYAAESVVSNTQLYKQAGNSITVDVLYYIFVELYKAMPYLFNNLKLSSFFSGIGAFESALDRLYERINSENFHQP